MILTNQERRLAELTTRLESRFAAVRSLADEVMSLRRQIENLEQHIKHSLLKPGYEASANYEIDVNALTLLKERRAITQGELEKQNSEIQDFGELVNRCKEFLQDERRARIDAEGPRPAKPPIRILDGYFHQAPI